MAAAAIWCVAPAAMGAEQGAPAGDETERREPAVVVTGTVIGDGGAVGLPVDAMDRTALERLGLTRPVDFALAITTGSGVDGQTNQFASGWLPGTANVNLRGLGPGRTLVLLNGHRLAPAPFPVDEQAQTFVDINQIPFDGLARIETLRSGAAALHGSDAIAGVVNFLTRRDFKGLEFRARYDGVHGSSGDAAIAAAMGWRHEKSSARLFVSGDFPGELPVTARGWAARPLADNTLGGWSGVGNPGSFARATPDGAMGVRLVPDTQCGALGGAVSGSSCRFPFARFSNLVEQAVRWTVFGEAEHAFPSGVDARLEFLFADGHLPSYDTSPSLPPRRLFGQIVPAGHPALVAYRDAHPEWSDAVYGTEDPATTDLIYYGRAFGVGGNPLTGGAGTGERAHTMWRFLARGSGEPSRHFRWEVAVAGSGASSRRTAVDIYRAGFANALRGFGICSDPVTGAIPDGVVPGEGECVWFNPFSSAIARSLVNGAVNPGHVPALGNSPALARWLFGTLRLDASTQLVEIGVTAHGDTGLKLPGGEIEYAAGLQYRRDQYQVAPDAVSNLDLNPGPEGGGVYSFLAGARPVNSARDVVAFRVETRARPLTSLQAQIALRGEIYVNGFVSLDPKLSLQWRPTPAFALRAGLQSAFRGPTLNQLGGRTTTLQLVRPTSAFKAVDLAGDPGLQPERSFAFDAGAVVDNGEIRASLDYWRIEVTGALGVESYNDIVALAQAALEAEDFSAPILGRIDFDNPANPPAVANIAAIRTRIVNGPAIVTSGLSLRFDWQRDDLWGGTAGIGFAADYVFEFRVGDSSIEGSTVRGGDLVGRFNRSNPFRSQPRWKGRIDLSYEKGAHHGGVSISLVGAMDDERGSAADAYRAQGLAGPVIAQWTVLDLRYSWRISDQVEWGIDIGNLFDVPPPFAAFQVNYDPFSHTPQGRVVRLSLTVRR